MLSKLLSVYVISLQIYACPARCIMLSHAENMMRPLSVLPDAGPAHAQAGGSECCAAKFYLHALRSLKLMV